MRYLLNGKGVRMGEVDYRYVSLLRILFSDLLSTEKKLARRSQCALILLSYCGLILFS